MINDEETRKIANEIVATPYREPVHFVSEKFMYEFKKAIHKTYRLTEEQNELFKRHVAEEITVFYPSPTSKPICRDRNGKAIKCPKH